MVLVRVYDSISLYDIDENVCEFDYSEVIQILDSHLRIKCF